MNKRFLFFVAFCGALFTLNASAQNDAPLLEVPEIDATGNFVPEAAETSLATSFSDGNGSEILCLPGSYQLDPESCNPLGPSEYITDLADQGVDYPPLPFPGHKIDPELSRVPYLYAKINIDNNEVAKLYNTAEEAAADGTPAGTISTGAIRYVSYTDTVDINDAHYVRSKGRELWLRASPAGVNMGTLGRTFTKTPERDFGWIVEGCNPYLKPDFNSGFSTAYYYREDVVQVYETLETKDTTWFKIGDDQWVDRIHFRCAHIKTTPPEGIPSDRWIEVDLLEQVVMVYENYELIYAAMVATGMKPYYTQPGIFQIREKHESENMTGSFEEDGSDYYWLEDVPFTMYFDQLRAFHGAYWRAWYGYEQSHGCVNMSNGDAHWLYNWAQVGEWVYVHDPSGQTPTDPAYYKEGGA